MGLRKSLVRFRDALDGQIHDTRRARALGRIGALDPTSALVLCQGNICRSPYAATMLKAKMPPEFNVVSGGLTGPGATSPDEAVDAAEARGIIMHDHRSRLATLKDLDEAGLIIVFDRFNVRGLSQPRELYGEYASKIFWLGDFDPEWTGKRAIIDPWGKSRAFFDETFERIDRCLDVMAGALNGVGDYRVKAS